MAAAGLFLLLVSAKLARPPMGPPAPAPSTTLQALAGASSQGSGPGPWLPNAALGAARAGAAAPASAANGRASSPGLGWELGLPDPEAGAGLGNELESHHRRKRRHKRHVPAGGGAHDGGAGGGEERAPLWCATASVPCLTLLWYTHLAHASDLHTMIFKFALCSLCLSLPHICCGSSAVRNPFAVP